MIETMPQSWEVAIRPNLLCDEEGDCAACVAVRTLAAAPAADRPRVAPGHLAFAERTPLRRDTSTSRRWKQNDLVRRGPGHLRHEPTGLLPDRLVSSTLSHSPPCTAGCGKVRVRCPHPIRFAKITATSTTTDRQSVTDLGSLLTEQRQGESPPIQILFGTGRSARSSTRRGSKSSAETPSSSRRSTTS